MGSEGEDLPIVQTQPNGGLYVPQSARLVDFSIRTEPPHNDNLGERSLAMQNTRKAYELRERVSERERLAIELHYYGKVTDDLKKYRGGS